MAEGNLLAIRAMFVAITSIQSSMGNPWPRLVAWIGLVSQALAPILMLLRKYSQGFEANETIAIALSASVLLVLAVTLPVKGYRIEVGDGLGLKMKVWLVLLLSVFAFVAIGDVSPEASVAAYLVYCCMPLQRLLKLPITRTQPEVIERNP